jgi:ATP-grasp domain
MRYVSWRDRERDPGHVPDLDGVDRTRAAAALTITLDRLTAAEPTAWLPPADAVELLAAYGIDAVPTLPAPTADEAVPIADQGVEMVVGVVHDPAFGPLVMLGAGGVAGELLADRTYRILPLTDRDAAAMVRSLQLAPLLFGYRGRPHAAVGKLEELLLRLARLADDLPVVAELDGNPVIVTTTGARVADIKVRVASAAPGLPGDRRMRS